jgi:hypothetical protein
MITQSARLFGPAGAALKKAARSVKQAAFFNGNAYVPKQLVLASLR